MKDDIVIVAAKRTALGNFLGQFANLSAPELGAHAHSATLAAAQITSDAIDTVISGCVLQAGIGQAPARQAALLAKLPNHVNATTINKMCGSGMQAVIYAHDAIRAGSAQIVLAGGMESMSQAPYLLRKARTGYRLGHGEILDHMLLDGLEDAYTKGKLMGCFAEDTANLFEFTRTLQDDYAAESMRRALAAQQNAAFLDEITPITYTDKHKTYTVTQDESPDLTKIDKIVNLKPSFCANGSITPASSSSIADGAASLLLMTLKRAHELGLKPLARIVGHACHSQEPQWFALAPIEAIRKLLTQINWQITDVDLFEINEAFAVVSMAAIQSLQLDPNKVNIHGGACALGHPLGASGARIIVTLLHALKRHKQQRGIASLCIGGGEATAIAIELL